MARKIIKCPKTTREMKKARKPGGKHPRYRLEDLLKKVGKQNRHPEIDFGPPKGREVW